MTSFRIIIAVVLISTKQSFSNGDKECYSCSSVIPYVPTPTGYCWEISAAVEIYSMDIRMNGRWVSYTIFSESTNNTMMEVHRHIEFLSNDDPTADLEYTESKGSGPEQRQERMLACDENLCNSHRYTPFVKDNVH